MKLPSPFNTAITMAHKSQANHKIGACLTRGNRIISAGFNQVKTHPFIARLNNDYIMGLHAEMHTCLGVANAQLVGASIYIVRLRKAQPFGLAKPCTHCTKLLGSLGLKQAIYTDNNGGFNIMKF